MISNTVCQDIVAAAKSKPKYLRLLKEIGEIPIECIDCSQMGVEGNSKALTRIDPLSIEICANRNHSVEAVEISLIHELVHVYDYKFKRYDMFTCDGLAASEIRAAREAECAGSYLFDFFRDRCVKERATASTSNIFPRGVQASNSVRRMYEVAVNDLEPKS